MGKQHGVPGTPIGATRRLGHVSGNSDFSYSGLLHNGYEAVIVNGTGLGQHRKIVGSNGSIHLRLPGVERPARLDQPMIIAGVVSRCAIYHNSLQGKSTYVTQMTASAGIEPFGNSYDFIADDNTDQPDTQWPVDLGHVGHEPHPAERPCAYFNYIANNTIQNCLTGIDGIR